mmetsp:Transcript_27699/g.79558  ORF Transcript_27699/g.79558 Transcript_27699/m.79558 type:complete len:303 (-) Transcript_27699:560-1468(-)
MIPVLAGVFEGGHHLHQLRRRVHSVNKVPVAGTEDLIGLVHPPIEGADVEVVDQHQHDKDQADLRKSAQASQAAPPSVPLRRKGDGRYRSDNGLDPLRREACEDHVVDLDNKGQCQSVEQQVPHARGDGEKVDAHNRQPQDDDESRHDHEHQDEAETALADGHQLQPTRADVGALIAFGLFQHQVRPPAFQQRGHGRPEAQRVVHLTDQRQQPDERHESAEIEAAVSGRANVAKQTQLRAGPGDLLVLGADLAGQRHALRQVGVVDGVRDAGAELHQGLQEVCRHGVVAHVLLYHIDEDRLR